MVSNGCGRNAGRHFTRPKAAGILQAGRIWRSSQDGAKKEQCSCGDDGFGRDGRRDRKVALLDYLSIQFPSVGAGVSARPIPTTRFSVISPRRRRSGNIEMNSEKVAGILGAIVAAV